MPFIFLLALIKHSDSNFTSLVRNPTYYFFCHVKQDGLKLNFTHQLLVYADDVKILGGSVHTIKENAEALIVASKEIGLDVRVNVSRSECRTKSQYED